MTPSGITLLQRWKTLSDGGATAKTVGQSGTTLRSQLRKLRPPPCCRGGDRKGGRRTSEHGSRGRSPPPRPRLRGSPHTVQHNTAVLSRARRGRAQTPVRAAERGIWTLPDSGLWGNALNGGGARRADAEGAAAAGLGSSGETGH